MVKISTLFLFLLTFCVVGNAQSGNSLKFDGVNDRVDLGTGLINFTNGNGYTVEGWFKTPTVSDPDGAETILYIGDGTRAYLVAQIDRNAAQGTLGRLRVSYRSNGVNGVELTTANNQDDDMWHHMAIVFTPTAFVSGTVTLYLDGNQVASQAGQPVIQPTNGAPDYRFGVLGTSNRPYGGILDEWRFWEDARTINASTFDADLTPTDANNATANGLVAHYKFDQGTAEGDNSGSTDLINGVGTNGTLVNFTLMGASSNFVTPAAPLPVELSHFGGKFHNGSVVFDWQTTLELNNAGFEVEASVDGRTWETLGFVQGAGTTETVQDYSFTDRQPVEGTNYYRLKQIDLDGLFQYFDAITVYADFGEVKEGIHAFPNPATQGTVQLQIDNPNNERVQITLFDATGKLLQETVANESLEQLKLPNAGMYHVMVRIGNEVYHQKVVAN